MQIDSPDPSREGHGSYPSGLRAIVVTAAVNSGLIVLAGIAAVGRPWIVVRRFHAEDFIPRLAALTILRELGPWRAAVTAAFFVTAMEHNRQLFGQSPAHRTVEHKHGIRAVLDSRFGLAALSAAVVPILYIPVCALAFGSSMATARLCLGLRPSTFFELVEPGDVLHGGLLALLFGCVPASWSLLGARLTRAPHRGIGFKLFMTWLVMLGVSLGAQLVLGLAGSAE